MSDGRGRRGAKSPDDFPYPRDEYPHHPSGLIHPIYTYLPPGYTYSLDILTPPLERAKTRDTPTSHPGETNTCENITFPQLRWRAVNMYELRRNALGPPPT